MDANATRDCPMRRKWYQEPKFPGMEITFVMPPETESNRCVQCLALIPDGSRSVRICSNRCSRYAAKCGRRGGQCVGCGVPLPDHCSKYCSLRCDQMVNAPPSSADCLICGAEFVRGKLRLGTCSAECATEAKRERRRRRNRKRRMAVRGLPGGDYTVHDIVERDGNRCHLCGKKVDMSLSGSWPIHPRMPSVDHLVPVSAGGVDEMINVALAHFNCNSQRGVSGPAQL